MDVIERINTSLILGDTYYELFIRKYLIDKKITNVNQLHKTAIKYIKGNHNQISYFIEQNLLSQDEESFYKRGRNASGPGRKKHRCKNLSSS